MIDSSEHLHHELRIQHHAVTGFLPRLLLLPWKPTHTQPVPNKVLLLVHTFQETYSQQTRTYRETQRILIQGYKISGLFIYLLRKVDQKVSQGIVVSRDVHFGLGSKCPQKKLNPASFVLEIGLNIFARKYCRHL